jgi:hypothetical protein
VRNLTKDQQFSRPLATALNLHTQSNLADRGGDSPESNENKKEKGANVAK